MKFKFLVELSLSIDELNSLSLCRLVALKFIIIFTSFPDHFDLAWELDIEMKSFDLCYESYFVNFKVFIGH